MLRKFAWMAFALMGLAGNSALAANRSWTGEGSNNLWSNPDNWGGVAPVAGDRLFFSGTTNLSTFNDLAAGTSFEQINFSTSAGPFILEGNDIVLTISVSSNGVTQPQTIKLNYSQSPTAPGAVSYAYGALLELLGDISGSGGLAVVNGGIVRVAGANTYTGSSRIGNGTLIIDSLKNVGAGSSSLGAPTTVEQGTISLAEATGNGVLSYVGAGDTTDRVINLAGSTGSARIDQSGEGLLKFTSDLTATGIGNKTLFLQGSRSGEGEIGGAIVDSAGNTTSLNKTGSGRWILSGNNSFTGTTTVNAGTLELNYETSGGSKLSNTSLLALNGGKIELSGGSHTEAVGSTTVNAGGTRISRAGGTSRLALGAITFTGGAVDFEAANIATTTTLNGSSGILSQRATVAGSDFAAVDGSGNIVAYTGYTGFVGSMVADTNYSLAGSAALSGNVGAASNTLKIAPSSAGQSLTVGASTLTLGALLFTGNQDFTISTTGASKLAVTSLHNYGTGDLYYGSIGSTGLTQYGTGRTILTADTTTNGNMTINGGLVQFSANAQLANSSANRIVTLNGGTLRADTSSGNIALNNAGLNSRTFTINAGGGAIDVIGGNDLTISGVISGNQIGQASLIFGSESSSGRIVLTAANTYRGPTVLRGGTVHLGVAEVVNTSGPLGMSFVGNPGSILFEGGTLQYSSVNQFDYSGRFALTSNQQYRVDTNGQNVTWGSTLVSAGGSLTKSGAGNLTLTAANTYTGSTTISAGTLILSGRGSVANSAVIRLAGGALDVGGVTGGFSLASGQSLTGQGTVIGNATISAGAILSIGNSPGTMSFDGDLSLSAGSTSLFEINGFTAGLYDLAAGIGAQTVTFGGTLDLVFQSGFSTAGSVAIFDFENYGGAFSTINMSGLAAGYTASFDEGTGFVTVAAIPEPATSLLVAMGVVFVTTLRRGRRS